MEKLKAKHDHKLTDILKVLIFGLMLILPGLIILPSMLYYGVNQYATAPTEQVEKIEYERVNFNQLVPNEFVDYDWTEKENYSLVFNFKVDVNDKIYFRFNPNIPYNIQYYQFYNATELNTFYNMRTEIFTCSASGTLPIYYARYPIDNVTQDYSGYFNVFNLTQMFGSGNEPTIEEFNRWYPNDFYDYTESRYEILEIPTGTYETYTDITTQIQYNWKSLWQQPIFSWTNYTILKQGLDNFTSVFGITNNSYITNLLTYELIIVAIYIVIDIVITLFTWLTHLFNKE